VRRSWESPLLGKFKTGWIISLSDPVNPRAGRIWPKEQGFSQKTGCFLTKTLLLIKENSPVF